MLSIFLPTRHSWWFSGTCGLLLLPLLSIGYAHAGQTASGSSKSNNGTRAKSPLTASQPGFWKQQNSTRANPPLTATEIAGFLPDRRGPFQFPNPYNTTGIRVTLPSDCGGQNCVNAVGYSYWATMSNSAGLDYMWIMVGLRINKGGDGPTLYKLNKSTNEVTKIGPIFTGPKKYSSCELCYFSYSKPDALYFINDNLSSLDYINVTNGKINQVFNVHDYAAHDHLWQCSTSYDDTVSACTLENSSYKFQGCLVHSSTTGKFQFFPAYTQGGGFDECHIFPDGKHLLINEDVPNSCPACGDGTVIVNLVTGKQTVIKDKQGAGGHYALGFGYYLMVDNWDPYGGVAKLWDASNLSAYMGRPYAQPYSVKCPSGQGGAQYCGGGPSHPSWLNAVPATVTPISHQYACDSTANAPPSVPLASQVTCFYLDYSDPPSSLQALVIAPTMINGSKTGCGTSVYANDPKGNIDYTGHYFMWSANLNSNGNCQVFIVKIPISQLHYPPPVMDPPQVSIIKPANGASVTGTVTVTAKVRSDIKLSNVIWKVDEQRVGSSATAPYAYDLDTNKFALGQHKLIAVATNTDKTTGTDTHAIVIVERPTPTPLSPVPQPDSKDSGSGGGGGSLSIPLLAALTLLAALGIARKWS